MTLAVAALIVDITGTMIAGVCQQDAAYLNQKQLAEWLGRTPRYVAGLVERSIIPDIRLSGKACLYDREKVRRALGRFEIKVLIQPECGLGWVVNKL